MNKDDILVFRAPSIHGPTIAEHVKRWWDAFARAGGENGSLDRLRPLTHIAPVHDAAICDVVRKIEYRDKMTKGG